MIGLCFSFWPQQHKQESVRHGHMNVSGKNMKESEGSIVFITDDTLTVVSYLVGTGTSVRAPSMTACCRRTNATKGFSRKSTSPTSTFDASASRGNFFMNLFFSCRSGGGQVVMVGNTGRSE